MTELKKFSYAQWFGSAHYWFAIAPLYFFERGLTIEQTFSLISINAVCVVLFEYPTGILADTFSHKKAAAVGTIIMAIAFSLNIFSLGYLFYAATMVLSAFGMALRSGSNDALLHNLSDHFKRDYGHVRAVGMLWSVGAMIVGSYLFTINVALPYLFTGLSLFIAALIIFSIKESRHFPASGNVYATVRESVVHVRNNYALQALVILSGSFLAVFFAIKWFMPVIFEMHGIDPALFGAILSVSTLLMALSTKLSGTRYNMRLAFIIPLVFLSILLLGVSSYIGILIGGILLLFFARGFMDANLLVLINSHAKDGIRASILSLRMLLGRIAMSLYIVIIGYLLGFGTTIYFTIFTIGFLGVVSIGAFIVLRRADWMNGIQKT